MVNLIGINGRIKSGKDTVGKIIQMLVANATNKHCLESAIEFGELDVHGFDKMLQAYSGWTNKKFAGKLKQIVSILTGIPVEKFEDQDFKLTLMGSEWDWIWGIDNKGVQFKDQVHPSMIDRKRQYTVREFLQVFGTDCVRNNLHVNTWVNALFADYKPIPIGGYPQYGTSDNGLIAIGYNQLVEYPNWLITDMRFPNEFDAIKQRGGITIRVLRDGTKKLREHASETALDNHQFDYEIDNNGTFDELVHQVKNILQAEKII